MSFVLFLCIISVMNRNSLKLLNCLICEPQLSPAPLYTLYFLSILYYAYLLAMVHVCIEKWRTEYKHTPLISRKNSRTDSQVINLHRLPLCKFLCAKCRSKLLVTKTLVKWFLALCDIANWSGETYCLTKTTWNTPVIYLFWTSLSHSCFFGPQSTTLLIMFDLKFQVLPMQLLTSW